MGLEEMKPEDVEKNRGAMIDQHRLEQKKELREIELALKAKMPYKWRVQSTKPSGCMCVSYIDARDAMDMLDKILGISNWQDEYYTVGGNTYCKLGLRIQGEWVWKSDAGAESKVEKEKGLASDAFKRACVKHGIGRFLYDNDMVWIRTWKGTNYKGQEEWQPMHEESRGNCPDNLRLKKDGKVSLLINTFKISEYITKVLKK